MSGWRLRPATPRDLDGILALKAALAIPPARGTAPTGGFLLGSTREGYEAYLTHGTVRVLEDDGGVAGVSVVLPDDAVRASDLWTRRAAIHWYGAEPRMEGARVGYFDQLAVLPGRGRRVAAAAMALAGVEELEAGGHTHVFATTVAWPVENRASHPFLEALGWTRAGEVDETYPGAGRIVSALWHLDLGGQPVADRLARVRAGSRTRTRLAMLRAP